MPKNQFRGTFEELQAQVERTGIGGSWQESNNNGICKTYTTDDGAILNWWVKNRTINFQGSPDVRIAFETAFYGNDNVENTDAPVVRRATRQPNNRTKIFIVHGHDQGSLDQLELILRRLELAPYILQNNTAQSNTLIEALEQEIYDKNTVFGIVLMTPDDFGYSKNESDDKRKPRARQNVILEMGMVMASLGRNKTVILKKGTIEHPSDIDGIIYMRFEEHLQEVAVRLANQMKTAGIEISNDLIARFA